jgi:L,D-peptidoglycan transpeptidase YkuD (ErfK/YbiS/YcfS/YnhG family)
MRRGDVLVTRWGAFFAGRRIPCAIGRGGITAEKREGDGATPAGAHRIMAALYRADRLARRAVPGGARAIGPGDLWSDDSRDTRYNQHVRAPYAGGHERLRRAERLYDLVLITDWNRPRAVPGRGSAIFIHTWRKPRHPTAGCVAFARRDLLWLALRMGPRARLIVRP